MPRPSPPYYGSLVWALGRAGEAEPSAARACGGDLGGPKRHGGGEGGTGRGGGADSWELGSEGTRRTPENKKIPKMTQGAGGGTLGPLASSRTLLTYLRKSSLKLES